MSQHPTEPPRHPHTVALALAVTALGASLGACKAPPEEALPAELRLPGADAPNAAAATQDKLQPGAVTQHKVEPVGAVQGKWQPGAAAQVKVEPAGTVQDKWQPRAIGQVKHEPVVTVQDKLQPGAATQIKHEAAGEK